jgi:hypothetical protein
VWIDAAVRPCAPVLLVAVNGAEARAARPGKTRQCDSGSAAARPNACAAPRSTSPIGIPPSRRRTLGARPAHRARLLRRASRQPDVPLAWRPAALAVLLGPAEIPEAGTARFNNPLHGLLRAGQGRRRFTLLVPDKLGQSDSRPYSHWAPVRASAYCAQHPDFLKWAMQNRGRTTEIAALEGSPTGGQA